MRPRLLLLTLVVGCATAPAPGPSPGPTTTTTTTTTGEKKLAPNAPVDRPIHLEGAQATSDLDRQIQPYVEQARATYPEAKRRYLAGLPKGQAFFVTVKLREGPAFEQVFLAVDRIADGQVTGRIWNHLNTLRSYRPRQSVRVAETELLDWLISKPDGTEEGNFVGKFIDTLSAPPR